MSGQVNVALEYLYIILDTIYLVALYGIYTVIFLYVLTQEKAICYQKDSIRFSVQDLMFSHSGDSDILILIFIMRSSNSYKAKSPLNIELVNG
jgi:hypothetical protein